MAIPTFQDIALPLLQMIGDGRDHPIREATEQIADVLGLTDEERQQRLPSGTQTTVANRVAWAKVYLKGAGLLMYPERGMMRITPEGLAVLAEKPARIDLAFLQRFPAFQEWRRRTRPKATAEDTPPADATPQESLESAYQTLREALAAELLEKVKTCPPEFFERLVVKLLVAMGYGGARPDSGRAIGRSGDGGIDGVINEDRLGLDTVCVQAKRWENTVSRPDIQAFAGALQARRTRKGVFITTSNFSKEARDFVERIETKIVLVDGSQLAEYMIDHDIGVATIRSYELKRIDLDFFEDA